MTTSTSSPKRYLWQLDDLKDFTAFLHLIWHNLRLPAPTPLQKDIASFLATSGQKRLILQAFRGVGKSYITAAYAAYRLYWNPQISVLIVSATKARSDSLARFLKQILTNTPALRPLIPDATKGNRDGANIFDIGPALPKDEPSVKSVGITGQITGSRADLIIADDIEIANNSFTTAMREKLADTVKEFDAVLKPGEGSSIVYLGTPQSMMSIYNTLATRGYLTRKWPARVPTAAQKESYGSTLAPLIAQNTATGAPTEPERFGHHDLLEREASYGRSGFALQYMLDTAQSDALKFPLRLSDLTITSLDNNKGPQSVVWSGGPESLIKDLSNPGQPGDGFHHPMALGPDFAPWQGVCMHLDPAGKGRDEFAWAIVKHLNGHLYASDVGGHMHGYADAGFDLILSKAQNHKVSIITYTGGYGDDSLIELLKRRALQKNIPLTFEQVPTGTGHKELRIIQTLEPILASHRLTLDRRVVDADFAFARGDESACFGDYPNKTGLLDYSLTYQLTHITADKGSLAHDDRLEALSYACRYWTDRLKIDENRAIAQARDETIEAEQRLFDLHNTAGFDILALTGDIQLALRAAYRADMAGESGETAEKWTEV